MERDKDSVSSLCVLDKYLEQRDVNKHSSQNCCSVWIALSSCVNCCPFMAGDGYFIQGITSEATGSHLPYRNIVEDSICPIEM